MRDLIRRMGQTKTVILSTHILPEVEASCDRAVILIDGLIRADGSLQQLTQSRAQVVQVATDDPNRAMQTFEGLRGVGRVTHGESSDGFHSFRLELSGEQDVGEQIFEVARQQGWPLRELRRDDRTLEQVFRQLTEAPAPEVAA